MFKKFSTLINTSYILSVMSL